MSGESDFLQEPVLRVCEVCEEDRQFLLTTDRPAYEGIGRHVRVVDLFSGCGGLSLGIAEGARRLRLPSEVALAVDIDQDVADVFRLNFPKANVVQGDVAAIFDGELGADLTEQEQALADDTGSVDILLAGAPCQGHSDLNNHTRRRDPKNALYLRAARAVQVLRPAFVLFENVPAVQLDSRRVVEMATRALESTDYLVASRVMKLDELGVPR
jgi:DNA (cytosine-5)-methyltransferase 1